MIMNAVNICVFEVCVYFYSVSVFLLEIVPLVNAQIYNLQKTLYVGISGY
jgi:hypothetical protein